MGGIFCKDRFTSRAREFGLTPGFAFDISEGWDLNDPESRRRALTVQEETEPFIVVGSPRCTAWSSLLNFGKTNPEVFDDLMREALVHLDFSFEVYERQCNKGKYFLHEAPHMARSWRIERVQKMMARSDVYGVRMAQCETGQSLSVKLDDGTIVMQLCQGTTGWLTNSKFIARQLEQFQCRNRNPNFNSHVH